MTEQDKKRFALLMGEVGAAFGKDPQKEMLAVYFNHTADYPIEAVAYATKQAIRTGERFPVIKTLREFANAYRPPSGKKPMTDAPQIAEFTETQCKDAQTEIQNIINGLSDHLQA